MAAVAQSGDTSIKLSGLRSALSIGDAIDLEIEPGDFYRVEVTGAAAAGDDTGQSYRTVSVKTVGDTALRRRVPKGTAGYVPSDISARTFVAILWNQSTGAVVQNYNNAAINQDTGTVATRGKIEVTVSDATSSGLTATVTTGGPQLDAWIAKQLPKLSADSTTPHPLRIELDEVVGSETVQFSFGVVAVTQGHVAAA